MKQHDLLFANQFDTLAPHYDEVMSVVPYRHWVQYLRRMMKRYGWKPHNILDIATGTGSVALLLAQAGFRVTGVDLSARMIDTARQKAAQSGVGEQLTFLTRDAAMLDFSEDFELAISLFDSLNYLLSTRSLQQAFAGVYRALRHGGGFIFDLNGEYALEHNLFSQDNLWDEETGVKHIWTARYDKKTRMATVEMQFFLADGRVFHEVHKERAHRHNDVITFLRAAGFEFLDAFDAYSFLPAGRRSERIFYVAKKM